MSLLVFNFASSQISFCACCRFFNYESSLRDCLHQKWKVELGRENPLASTEFRNVSMHDKVDIVYSLCLYRLDTEDVNDAVKVCIVLCTLVGIL